MIVQVKKENNNNTDQQQQQQQQTVANKDKDKEKDKDNKENNGNSSSKDKQSKDNNNKTDSFKKFENEGVVFKAKLIGSELVLEPRGDKMCQNSIQRLKAIIKGTNAHKRRVVLKISLNGVKVYDEKTNEILHHHEVSQISFIASDDTDSRSFGYVGDVPNKAHQFVCFKTSGPAINVITVINSLFEAVVEKKKQLEREKQEEKEKQIISDDDIFGPTTTTTTTTETKASTNNNSNTTTPATSNNNSNTAAALAANLINSPAPPAPAQTSTTSKATSGLAFATSFTPSSAASSGIGKDSFDLIDDSGIMAVPWPSTPIPVASSNNPGVPNRSLIYNHSSVSLSDAPLNRQSSFTSSSVKNDSYVDRYAVFNDIDNLPSIFESTSLNSVNKLSMNNINSSTGSILEPMNSSSSAANMMMGGGPFGSGASSGGPGMNIGGGMGGGSVGNRHHQYQQHQQQQQHQQHQHNKMMMSGMGGSMGGMPNHGKPHMRQTPNFHMAAAHNNFSKSFNTTYLQQTSSASSGFQSADQDISSTSAGARSASTLEANMFRRTNPFDDDFFA